MNCLPNIKDKIQLGIYSVFVSLIYCNFVNINSFLFTITYFLSQYYSEPNSFFARFFEQTKEMTPDECGKAIMEDEEIAESHEQTAAEACYYFVFFFTLFI